MNSVAQGRLLVQGQAVTKLTYLVRSSDGVTPATGLSPTVQISKAGTSLATIAGTVTEVGNGLYAIAFTTADTGTFGDLFIQVSASTAITTQEMAQVVAFNPFDVVRLGLTSLPNVVSGQAGSIITSGTGANQLATTTGEVTIGAYATGLSPAAQVLVNPAQPLATDASGNVVLQPTGLDNIPATAPTTVAITFPQMVVQTWRRFFKRCKSDASNVYTFADDNQTVVTTQAYTTGTGTDVGAAA